MTLPGLRAPNPGPAGGDSPPPTIDLLRRQLDEEYAAKQSFEARGMAVITTSAALAALSFGVAKFAVPSAPLTGLPAVALVVALVAFSGAAICGLMTNWPSYKYRSITPEGLDELVSPERWLQDRDDLYWSIAQGMVAIVKDARSANDRKGMWLNLALIAEILAVVALTVTVAALARP